MYYIEQENNEIIKYGVLLDVPRLKQLKHEIIRDCGEIIPHCYQSVVSRINEHDIDHIFHYNEKYIGTSEGNDFFSTIEEIYEYSYEEHKDTKLSALIQRLLNGDTSVISEIKNPVLNEEKKESILNPAKAITKFSTQKISEINSYDLEKLKKQVVRYQQYQELNKDRKSDLIYYPLALECIKLVERSRMSMDKIEKRNALLKQIEILQEQVDKISDEIKPFYEDMEECGSILKELKKKGV